MVQAGVNRTDFPTPETGPEFYAERAGYLAWQAFMEPIRKN